MSNQREWDIALPSTGNNKAASLPAAIGRVLNERGMHRAKLTITDDGLLIKPYVAERVRDGRPRGEFVVLPEWGS